MSAPPLISYTDVAKTFDGGRVIAVDDVSLEVAEGEFLAIVGGSGSGKTTLLRLANRLIKADRGRITVEGEDVGNVDPIGLAGCFRISASPAISASRRSSWVRRPTKSPRGSTNCSIWCGSTARNIATGCRMNSPAASASASAWRGRSPPGRASC